MDDNASIVLRVFSAVEDRDRDRLFGLLHEDVEFHDAASLPYGGTLRGRAALQAALDSAPETTWLGAWDPLQPTAAERRMDPRVVAGAGDDVSLVYTQRALKPTGERFEAPVMGLYTVRDGLFARAQMFHYDTAAILRFLSPG